MAYDKQINARLASFGLTVKDLTADELKRAREEQKERNKGVLLTDGVLTSPEIISRSLKKGTKHGNRG